MESGRFGVPGGNRTHNRDLGGPRYIHLTTGTKDFRRLSAKARTFRTPDLPQDTVTAFYCNTSGEKKQEQMQRKSEGKCSVTIDVRLKAKKV